MMEHGDRNTPDSLPWNAPVRPPVHHVDHGIQRWLRNKLHFFQQILQLSHKPGSVRDQNEFSTTVPNYPNAVLSFFLFRAAPAAYGRFPG